jgi:uncharacterized protein (TIGR01319 family)
VRTAHLLDIGSTYTKLLTVDLDEPGRFTSTTTPTTPDNLSVGVATALSTSPHAGPADLLAACSSAAGGLAVVVSGLVPRLSLEAARRAAFGSGARIVGSFAHHLTGDDIDAIDRSGPQVVLVTGGIDGGDGAVAEHNGEMLATLASRPAVVVACNRAVSAGIGARLADRGFEVHVVANLLPEIDEVDLEPSRAAIREVFDARIAHGPGLEEVTRRLGNELVPTPKATMDAVGFIGRHLGESIAAVEVGGATTNVHSHAPVSAPPGVVMRGLPPEALQRTVEGDLGIRHNADAVLDTAGDAWFDTPACSVDTDAVRGWVDRVLGTSIVPSSDVERRMDEAMALFCLRIGLERHSGRHVRRREPDGTEVVIQHGKDLTGCGALVAVGGALIHSSSEEAVSATMAEIDPDALAPRKAKVILDRHYTLYAVGLLAAFDQTAAADLARATLPGLWER